MPQEIVKIEKEEWYKSLIEDCLAIIIERTFNSEYERILCKWELGDRILKDEDKGITKSLHRCAVDLKKGERDLWYCLEFRRKYPKFAEEIKNWGKEMKWIGIKRELTTPNIKEIFEPELYNIWNFAKRDDNFGEKFFGQQTADLIMNLLYFYTDKEDLIWDAFAGSGLTNEVAIYMKRKCYSTDIKPTQKFIKEMDLTQELPDIQPKLIFMDPPYWKQAKNKYTEKSTDLANMDLKDFYSSFNNLFSRISKKYKNFIIALLIQNTQWGNEQKYGTFIRKEVEPHGLKLAEIMNQYFKFEHHIIVPYSTQQYTPQMVEIAKREKIILQLHRDLLIFKKQ